MFGYAFRIAVFFASVCCALVQAQNHDVIFVVDQSGSMGFRHGPGRVWPPNDPLDNRVQAVFQGYETLQSFLDARRTAGVVYRLHVVEFGSSIRLRRDLTTEITYDPAAAANLGRTNKDRLRQQLLPTNLGDTDTKAAFDEVLRLTGTLVAPDPSHVHVILVTDGRPEVFERGVPVPTGAGSDYRRELDSVLQTLRRRASLDIVGITGNDLDAFWPTWGPFWDQVSGGRAVSGKQGSEISVHVDRIIRERLGLPPQSMVSNPYFCPPYLRSITFTIFKKQSGGRVQIKDGQGRLVAPATGPGVTYVNEKTYDRYTIEDPVPGLWELDQQAASITVDLLYKQVARLEPKASINVRVPAKFSYEVLDSQGRAFQELPQYPVNVSAVATDPAGKQTSIPLARDSQGRFTSSAPYQFTSAGLGRLRITGTTTLPDKTSVTVFSADETLPITDKALLSLDAGTTLPGHIDLRFGRRMLTPILSLVRDGKPIAPNAVSLIPNDLLEFRLVKSDNGEEVAPWQKLKLSGQGFTAEVPVRRPFWPLDWLRRHEETFTEIRVNQSAMNSAFALVELRRSGSDPPFDRNAALPALRDNPLALPMVLGEWIVTFVSILLITLLLLLMGSYAGYRYLRKLCYWMSDRYISRRQVWLVLQQPTGEEISKRIVNDYKFKWQGPQVKIAIGSDPDHPEWKPAWLKVKRLFRPWAGGAVIRIKYPVRVNGKDVRHAVTLSEGEMWSALPGVTTSRVEAIVRVKRPGQQTGAYA